MTSRGRHVHVMGHLVAGLASVLASGCGGGDGDKPGNNPAFTVASADGVLTLSIPANALPAGVTQEQVKITDIATADLPAVNDEAVTQGWNLEPDGLALSSPAEARLTLPAARLGGMALTVLHESGQAASGRLEFLPLVPDAPADGAPGVLRAPLGHFSRLILHDTSSSVLATMAGSVGPPARAFVGQAFRTEVTYSVAPAGAVKYTHDRHPQAPRAYTETLTWDANSGWDPSLVQVFSPNLTSVATGERILPGGFEFAAISRCARAGGFWQFYSLFLDMDLREREVALRRVFYAPDGWGKGTCIEPSGDLIGDLVDSVSVNAVLAARQVADIINHGGRRETLTAAQVAATYNNTVYPCDLDDAAMKVVCPVSVQPMPAGDVLTFFLRVNAAIPRADATTSYIYSVVLDSDGAAANNWRFVAPFDWDYFQGTDRWYQLSWNHMTSTWSLTATQVDASQQTTVVPTTARAVLAGDSIVFHVSASELAAATGYRLSAFGHDGRFTQATRGGDVTGSNPTEALLPMPQ